MDLESLRRASLALAYILETMESIGTEETVAYRRKAENTTYSSNCNFIYSGSKGEGYNFSSSDLDLMLSCTKTLVFESTRDIAITDGPYETKLLMRRENCNPGFVILQLLNRKRDPEIRKSVVMYDDIRVVSSLLHRDLCRPVFVPSDFTGHGPCSSGFVGGIETDMAFCFECKMWPTEAYEFIFRPRRYQWPSKQFLDKIIERGCHLVAIGDKDSDISHVQWRISFSVAEKALMHSLNHTQFKVYGLLKIFLKQVIDKEHSVKGVLCSYFLKTALFYSLESTPASFWRDDLIILCFWFCFNKLYNWVIQGNCPNYFVPRNNMFRYKICGETQRNIVRVLYKYKCTGWTCLCQCEDFKIPQEVHNNSNQIYNFITKDLCVGIKLHATVHCSNVRISCFDSDEYFDDLNWRDNLTPLALSRSRDEQDTSTSLVSSVVQQIGQNFYSEQYSQANRIDNKNLYARAKEAEIFLLKCSGDDIITGLLYLATSYYKTGQYNKAICASKTMLSRVKPFSLFQCYCESKWERNFENLQSYLRSRGLNQRINDIIKRVVVFSVKITTSSKHMYPQELIGDDVEEALETSQSFYIPPLHYSVFLSFLCHHKLGNIDDSLAAMHDLKALVNCKTCEKHFIEYNMLAICLEKLGDNRGAVDACLQSIKLKPKKNGAYRLLDKIISYS